MSRGTIDRFHGTSEPIAIDCRQRMTFGRCNTNHMSDNKQSKQLSQAVVMLERPHLEKEGLPPHPDDRYTIESVRITLSQLIEKLTDLDP